MLQKRAKTKEEKVGAGLAGWLGVGGRKGSPDPQCWPTLRPRRRRTTWSG